MFYNGADWAWRTHRWSVWLLTKASDFEEYAYRWLCVTHGIDG